MSVVSIAASCSQAHCASMLSWPAYDLANIGTFAGSGMLTVSALPPSWVSTDNAFDELLEADVDWQQRQAAHEAAGKQTDFAIYKAASEALQACARRLADKVIASIISRELIAVWLIESNGMTNEYEVPSFFWRDPQADIAITTGTSLGLPLTNADLQRFSKAPLCFRRVQWDAWLADRVITIRPEISPIIAPQVELETTAPSSSEAVDAPQTEPETVEPSQVATASDPLPMESQIRRFLEDEILSRRGLAEPYNRDALVFVLRKNFPDLSVDVARGHVQKLPPDLRAKPGAPPGPRRT